MKRSLLACLGLVFLSLFLGLSFGASAGGAHPLCSLVPEKGVRASKARREHCDIIETSGLDGVPRLLRAVIGHVLDYELPGMHEAQIVMFGEIHDNPIHHRIRAGWIAKLNGWVWRDHSGRDRPPPTSALVFEHIRASQQAAIDALPQRDPVTKKPRKPDDFAKVLEWEKSGWPPFAQFKPLFDTALSFPLPILGGDVSREKIRIVAHTGLSALPTDEIKQLGLDTRLPGPLQAALLDELAASHCGLMPKSAFGSMADAQRYRDAHLARAVSDAAAKHGRAILLAGNGHVRSDRGVPYYLRQMAPNRKLVSVLFLEVEDGKTDPAAYVERDPDGRPAADYIVLTPRIERPDPCVEMKKRFAKPPK